MKRTIISLLLVSFFVLSQSAQAWSFRGVWSRIMKGQQYCNWFENSQGILNETHVTMNVRFDKTVIYKTVNPVNQGDINKLWGFSDCSSDHHQNSARFGWNWLQNKLRLWGYTYKNGVLTWVELATLNLNETYKTEIIVDQDRYLFKINDVLLGTQPRGCTDDGGIKYRLSPYFGGDEKSPQNINIFLQRI